VRTEEGEGETMMLQRLLVGFVGPHRLSRLYLANQLAYFGVAKGRIPAACVRELADDCMKAVRFAAKRAHRKRREVAVEFLEDRAADISSILDDSDPFDDGTGKFDNDLEAILRKHGVLKDRGVFLPFKLHDRRVSSSTRQTVQSSGREGQHKDPGLGELGAVGKR